MFFYQITAFKKIFFKKTFGIFRHSILSSCFSSNYTILRFFSEFLLMECVGKILMVAINFPHESKQSALVFWGTAVYTWVQNMCCGQSLIKGHWAMLWTLQSCGMRRYLLSFMAGVSRGCWPGQGGPLPGLQKASPAAAAGCWLASRLKQWGQGSTQLTRLSVMSGCNRTHLESLGSGRSFWEQTGQGHTSTSRVSGYTGPQQGTSEACVETDTLVEKSRGGWGLMTIPQSDHNAVASLDRAETDPLQVQRIQRGLAKVHLLTCSFISAPDGLHCFMFAQAF